MEAELLEALRLKEIHDKGISLEAERIKALMLEINVPKQQRMRLKDLR